MKSEVPDGQKFLIQLIEATDEADARRILSEMFGAECARVATLKRGTKRVIRPYTSSNPWKPSSNGYRVFVPVTWRIST